MNIILIGFKSSGKSTIGALLASATGRVFLDTDKLVEHLFYKKYTTQLTCRQIFSLYGEDEMRALETESIHEIVNNNNAVIATGGGIVLTAKNRKRLRELGVCFFVNPSFSILKKRLDSQKASPLLKNTSFESLYQTRLPFYMETAHEILHIHHEQTPDYIVTMFCNRIKEFTNGQ